MHREDRRRKFHEAIVNMLYPPPLQHENEDERVNTSQEGFNVDSIPDPDDLKESSSSSSSGECGSQKLTRAQRKRLRQKKLKEAASRRRKIIGPLLPSTSEHGSGSGRGGRNVIENDPPGVRQNVDEEHDAAIDKSGGETAACTNRNKLKQRRKAKTVAREKAKSSNMENQPCSTD